MCHTSTYVYVCSCWLYSARQVWHEHSLNVQCPIPGHRLYVPYCVNVQRPIPGHRLYVPYCVNVQCPIPGHRLCVPYRDRTLYRCRKHKRVSWQANSIIWVHQDGPLHGRTVSQDQKWPSKLSEQLVNQSDRELVFTLRTAALAPIHTVQLAHLFPVSSNTTVSSWFYTLLHGATFLYRRRTVHIAQLGPKADGGVGVAAGRLAQPGQKDDKDEEQIYEDGHLEHAPSPRDCQAGQLTRYAARGAAGGGGWGPRRASPVVFTVVFEVARADLDHFVDFLEIIEFLWGRVERLRYYLNMSCGIVNMWHLLWLIFCIPEWATLIRHSRK